VPKALRVLLSLLVLPGSAYAQTPPAASTDMATATAPQTSTVPTQLTMPSAVSQSEMQEHWYGWQTLATDAAWVGLLGIAVTAIAVDPSVNDEGAPNAVAIIAMVPAVPTYLFGAPIVHAVHGHWDKAGASLALRIGAPIALGYFGSGLGTLACPGKSSDTSNYHCVSSATVAGALVGLVAAIGVDAALLARERVSGHPSTGRWSPTVSLNRSGFSVGLGAEF
jgi:hypothetical protein